VHVFSFSFIFQVYTDNNHQDYSIIEKKKKKKKKNYKTKIIFLVAW